MDLGYVREELVAWVLCHGSAELPRVRELARGLHTRYLANEFGTGLVNALATLATETARREQPTSFKARLLASLGASSPPSFEPEFISDARGFDLTACTQGRPFFLTGNDSIKIKDDIQSYLCATSNEEVERIIESNFERLQTPGVNRKFLLESLLEAPYDAEAACEYVEAPLRHMRDHLARQLERSEGEALGRSAELEPVLTELIKAAAHGQASWMLREVSPSFLLEQSDAQFLAMEDGFCFASELQKPLPWLAWDIQQVLEHDGIGAVIEAPKVAEFRRFLQKHREPFREHCPEREWRLLDECLAYAIAENLDVVESKGILNANEGGLP